MVQLSDIFSTLPPGLRTPLIESFSEIAKNYLEQRWELVGLNGGKFCECVYSVIHGSLVGVYPLAPSKPTNMVKACIALEQLPVSSGKVGDRSLRIQIPRMLIPVYEIRNNRGVGHVGGDVNPNFMDATLVLTISSWVIAELVRVFHNISTNEAQDIVNILVERRYPLIWKEGDITRVLDEKMSTKDKVLMLLGSESKWIKETDIFKWVEYTNISLFQRRILKPLHTSRLIEYDMEKLRAKITPRGVKDIEGRILRKKFI